MTSHVRHVTSTTLMPPCRPIFVDERVRCYAPSPLEEAPRLGDEEYARARAAIPTFCLDGLPCGHTDDGRRVVILVVRRGDGPTAGPFRGSPWVVGGKWDIVTPWRLFVERKARAELFGDAPDVDLAVEDAIGDQLFATAWPSGGDGPFGLPGITIQFCFRVRIGRPVAPRALQPDRDHSDYVLLRAGDSMAALHPYIRDVVELSGWLAPESAATVASERPDPGR